MLVSVKICVALMFCTGLTSVWAISSCDGTRDLVCKSCKQIGICPPATTAAAAAGGGEPSPDERAEEVELADGDTCPDNQACLEVLNTAVCVAVASTNCNNCNGQPTACDPYDNTIVHACLPGLAPVEIETCENATCRAGECSSAAVPITDPAEACAGVTGPEYVIVKPTCDTGILCLNNKALTTFECLEDQYFDPKSYKCKSLPVDPCGSQGTGFFSNPTDCSVGIICVDGTVVAETPCGPSQVYDTEKRACGNEADVTCPAMDGCTFESDEPPPSVAPSPSPSPSAGPGPSPSPSAGPGPSPSPSAGPGPSPSPSVGPGPSSPPPPVTTLRPSTCSANNVNQRYPHETDCKKYWVCRALSSTSYTYVQNSCIGTLVFNPVSKYCDKAENVSSC